MAGPSRSKQGTAENPKSPKRKRNNKAAAETESVDVDKDYNLRSSERTQLSTQVEGTTKSPKGKRRGRATAETESVDPLHSADVHSMTLDRRKT
jgi:hypothetical protein